MKRKKHKKVMKSELVTLVPTGDLAVQFSPEILEKAGLKEGDKVSVTVEGDGFRIAKLTTLELDLDPKMILELAIFAHEKDITLNELIVTILEEFLSKNE